MKNSLLGLVLLVLAGGAAAHRVDDATARAILRSSANVYATAPAFRETITYRVKSPSADEGAKKIIVEAGPHGAVAVADPVFAAVARNGMLYVTKHDDSARFVARPHRGDLAASLGAVFGTHGELFEPVEIAMRSHKPLEVWLSALRFGVLDTLTIAAAKNGDGGAPDEIRLVATNGELTLRIDAASHRMQSFAARVRPAGAPPDMVLVIEGTFAFERLDANADVPRFETGRMSRVADLADLMAAGLAVGKPAPAFDLVTLDGEPITLADLRGYAVVLDFWATWCAPCWEGLKQTQRLHDWAQATGARVKVFAVNTLEQKTAPEGRTARVRRFLDAQHLALPCVLDNDEKAFHAVGSPGLPSVVVLSPAGIVVNVHQGLFPNMLGRLKEEIAKAEVTN